MPLIRADNRTFSGVLGTGGGIADLQLVANGGGESAALAPNGDVVVANGQVVIYGKHGRQKGRIDVPGRPLQLLFGGAHQRTLFILTHHALYPAQIDEGT